VIRQIKPEPRAFGERHQFRFLDYCFGLAQCQLQHEVCKASVFQALPRA
jgi:hypothetical protein